MFEPPAGFTDLLSDAENTPNTAPLLPLEVEGVGVLMARKPMPRSAGALAMTANRKTDQQTQVGYLNVFVREHLEAGRFETLLADMITTDLPDNAVHRVARAVATWGTARPYTAVVTLSLLVASHWRLIRSHLITHGVPDPMGLGSLHALLDVTESLVLESMHGDKPRDSERKRRQFLDTLYAPEPVAVGKDTVRAAPPGFDDDTMEADFDAFMAAAR